MLEILYRDETCIAVNKPAGMLVHRSPISPQETRFVLQTLRNQIGQHVYPIHRLDRPTSGALLLALTSHTARLLTEQFENQHIQKTYWAVVRGHLQGSGTINYPLKEEYDAYGATHIHPEKAAQSAITDWQSLAVAELPFQSAARYPTSRYSWLALTPHTGRRHQLRRHMKHIFHPIIGDTTHGDGRQNRAVTTFCGINRLMLHARSLSFTHPHTRHHITLEAEADDNWQSLFKAFGWA
ncbi:tRNA pseudouridine(65) synthase TruC [Neisseria wadsworthii]|uniref:tRNA pseudouridine(65) synthase TruC n=1 Tax=Neisseria wadsworthii TaxID=607711 RepID=UPI0015F72ECB|nr:tRNA pseudouridine(65) synthase TruC [Neisseria wadsworthii]QMT36776.1 tRNA pseudouridine(65) synthase TruC [Neisseria wadsworthii]